MYLVLINLVTPKARAKHEPYVQQTGQFVYGGAKDLFKHTSDFALSLQVYKANNKFLLPKMK